MGWDFETDPDYQLELDWVEQFVDEEIAPVDLVIEHAWDVRDPVRNALIKPLQEKVRERRLWGAHLGPELGGLGYGQLKLALLNEKLGRTHSGPVVFGCQAPDSGNAEILAHYGTDELKKRYLEPLLDGDIVSSFSMTEPHGGSDPTGFTTTAVLDGDEWVINGEKWFSSHASFASFLIVMAVTEPDAEPHKSMSMFVVPTDTPGINIVRNVGVWGHEEEEGTHAYIRYEDVRVPADHLLGERGQGFAVAQTRLGGGRIHHAMRTVGIVTHEFDLLCRAGRLPDHQGRDAGQQAARAGDGGRLLAADRAVPAAGAPHGLEDRPVRRLPQGSRRHLGGQGRDAEGAAATSPRARSRSTARWASPRSCPSASGPWSPSTWGWPTVRPRSTRSTWRSSCCAATRPTTGLFPPYHLPTLRESARRPTTPTSWRSSS